MPHMNIFAFDDAEIEILAVALCQWSKHTGQEIDSQAGKDAISRAINIMNSGNRSASCVTRQLLRNDLI